jgi:hypothetical protein
MRGRHHPVAVALEDLQEPGAVRHEVAGQAVSCVVAARHLQDLAELLVEGRGVAGTGIAAQIGELGDRHRADLSCRRRVAGRR